MGDTAFVALWLLGTVLIAVIFDMTKRIPSKEYVRYVYTIEGLSLFLLFFLAALYKFG